MINVVAGRWASSSCAYLETRDIIRDNFTAKRNENKCKFYVHILNNREDDDDDEQL